jgi:glycosyltransferase involved in cell wall biosynthesis
MKLTVGILSYNRPDELLRCLESLLPLPPEVDVLISDDASPRIEEIKLKIKNLLLSNKNFYLYENKINLGYDANMYNVISLSRGEYVLLVSDDDFFEPHAIISIINSLYKYNSPVSFVRFIEKIDGNYEKMSENKVKNRRDFIDDKVFPPREILINGSYVYNSILFSGLIFKKSEVLKIHQSISPYFKSIYLQVVIFCILSKEYGSRFIAGPGVIVYGDGENGFGSNSSSADDFDLKDRSSIHSNLKFNKRLLFVIDKLSIDLGSKFSTSFYKEFNFRNFSGMRIARNLSRKDLLNYWVELGSITKQRKIFHYAIFFLMLILPRYIINIIVNSILILIYHFKPGR